MADTTPLDAKTMKAALRTTCIEEGHFIEYILHKVDKGKIPADLVYSTFEWARKQPYKHRFQYFKQALIVRAAKIGITIDPKAGGGWPANPSTASNTSNRL
ncbi:MAG: hypothetical protein ABSA26_14330 [Thermoguttaceae bacterium]|jgi:hypothetical protein